MNRKQQEKLGDLLLDVAKYIITAVLLAGISLYDHTDQVVEEKKKRKKKK